MLTGLARDGTALLQAILALITAFTAILGALAALRGRSRKSRPSRPVVAPNGTPNKEKAVKLPELRQMKERQERLVFLNNLAGRVLLPVAVFAGAVYLILFGIFASQSAQPPFSVAAAVIVTALMVGCWALQLGLNPQWRAKQALARVGLVSEYVQDIEAELSRGRLAIETIKNKAKGLLDQAEARERDDIAIGV